MIRSAIKNYFKQFKYVFSGMGVIYLAMLIVLFALFFGAGRILSDAVGASVTELGEFLKQNLSDITLERLFEPGFFPNLLNGILSIFDAAGENVLGEFAALATGLLSLFLLSAKLASYLMRRLIRGDLRDGETKRGLLVLLFRYLETLLFAALAAVLIWFWVYSAVLLLLTFAVLKAFEQLFTTWFVYCKKSFRLKEMFRVRYVFEILAANFVSLAVNLAVILLLAAVVNVFFALLVAIPLVVYSFTVIDFTTVDYFNRLKSKGTSAPEPPERADARTKRKKRAQLSGETADTAGTELRDASGSGNPESSGAFEDTKVPNPSDPGETVLPGFSGAPNPAETAVDTIVANPPDGTKLQNSADKTKRPNPSGKKAAAPAADGTKPANRNGRKP